MYEAEHSIAFPVCRGLIKTAESSAGDPSLLYRASTKEIAAAIFTSNESHLHRTLDFLACIASITYLILWANYVPDAQNVYLVVQSF